MAIAIAKTTNIILTTVLNIFTMKSRSKEIKYTKRITLQDICDKHLEEGEWFVGLNGKVFPELQWPTTEVFPGEQVLFTPNLGGPLVAAAGAYLTSTAFVAFAFQMAATYGMGQLAKSLAPDPDISSATFQQHNTVSTQFYGWNPVTLQQPGVPIPKFYGDNLLHGNVVHAWTEPTLDGLAQTVHAIIGYGRGPVQGITTGDLGKNIFFQESQPAQNFESVQFEERYGTYHQTALSLFSSGVKLEYKPKIVVLNATPRTYIVRNDDYDGLDVEISFPRGVYFISGGSITSHTIGIKIEIAENGTENWATLVDTDVSGEVRSNYLIAYTSSGTYSGGSPVTISRGTAYKVKLTKTTEDKATALYGDTLQLNAIRSIYTDGFTYPGLALLGVIVEATDQLSGAFQCSIQQEGKVCEIYTDASTKSIEYTTDYAWVLYNTITSPLISGGSSGEIIDYVASLAEGLLAHYKMDENLPGYSGRIMADSSGNGIDGATGTDTDSMHITGVIGGAFDFNGNRFANVTDNNQLNVTSDDFTIAGWVSFNPTYTDTTIHPFTGRFQAGFAQQWLFGFWRETGLLQAEGKLMLNTRLLGHNPDDPNTSYVTSDAFTPAGSGSWNHVAVVRSGTDVLFYVDAVLIGSGTLSSVPEPTGTNLFMGYCGDIKIGYNTYREYLDGALDDLRFYTRPLSSTELMALFQKKTSLPPEDWEEIDEPYSVREYRGLSPDKVDIDSFLEFSNYTTETVKNPISFGGTEETRFDFNGGFDNHSNRWEIMKKICESANAVPLWDGSTISIALENPRELTQIFNIANIQKSAFRVFFLNQSDRATEVVVEYKKNNERSQISSIDTTLAFSGSATIERMFCNSESMAWRYAAEQVLRNRNVKVGLEFEVNTQAIMCRVGDRIRIAHPVFTKDIQCGGSIMQVIGSNTIQIDTSEDDIPALSSTSKIAIRSLDADGRERIEVYNVAKSNSNMVIIEGVWNTTPSTEDVFILGDTESFEADYEILNTKQVSDLMVKLTCQQYYEFREHELDSLL